MILRCLGWGCLRGFDLREILWLDSLAGFFGGILWWDSLVGFFGGILWLDSLAGFFVGHADDADLADFHGSDC